MDSFLAAIKDPGTVIVAIVGLFGVIFASFFQSRMTRQQLREGHQRQLELLKLSQEREDSLRLRKFEESDRADRLLVLEYIDQLLPRLCDLTSIYFLSGTETNRDDDEREAFNRMQGWMNATELDDAHPERTLSIRMAFLLFQLLASMRAALNARWTRPLSASQSAFLDNYEARLEPIMCSGRYPGDEFLYREQIEIIADEMLVEKHQGIVRPLNWSEFCGRLRERGPLRELTNLVARNLRFIFDDSNPRTTPVRRARQCRLAILALYLIKMSNEAGNDSWKRREAKIWRVVEAWFAWEQKEEQRPTWYVFMPGDVGKRVEASKNENSALPGISPSPRALPEAQKPTQPTRSRG